MKYSTSAKNVTSIDTEEAGESLSIFLSQQNDALARLRFEVYAILSSGGDLLVGSFFTSPPQATDPQGPPTRMVAYAVCPGAIGWVVYSSLAEPTVNKPGSESYGVDLGSSKGYSAPCGVYRVGQRYSYYAGATTDTSYTVVPGQKILSWSATAPSADGTVVLGTGRTIQVPKGQSVQAEPGSGLLMSESFIFTNVDWFIEFLESA